MNKEVCIDIKSTQFAEDGQDTTELFTSGRFCRGREKNKYKIIYEESEVTGFEGNIVTLNVDGSDLITMNREGDAGANLVIERGKKHHCHYGTPFGDFMVGITADEIRADLNDQGGNVYFKYTVDINSSYMYKNEMNINIREAVNQ